MESMIVEKGVLRCDQFPTSSSISSRPSSLPFVLLRRGGRGMAHISDIFQAIIMENVDELKRLLRSQKVNLAVPFRGTTALSLAVYKAHLPSLCALVESGAPLDIKSMDHLQRLETPIISSIRLGHNEIFLKLLHSGAKLDVQDFYNQTPLWYAVKEQRLSFVKLLLKVGAPITYQHGTQSPLNLVVQHLRYKVRRQLAIELVAAGMQVDLTDLHKRQPIIWAIHHGDFTFFRLLIEAGASYDVHGEESSLPKQWMEDAKVSQWLKDELGFPPPLMRQCRSAIRRHLRRIHNRDLRPLIETISLPSLLTKYLLLEDAIRRAEEKND